METTFILNREIMNELEDFSCDLEQIKELTQILHYWIWENIIENKDCNENIIYKLGTLINILSEMTSKSEKNIDMIIKRITPLT